MKLPPHSGLLWRGSPPTWPGPQPSNSEPADRRGGRTHSRDALFVSQAHVHLAHLRLTRTTSQEHFVSHLPAFKPIDGKNSFGTRSVRSPAHCYRLNYRAQPQSGHLPPPRGQRRGQVCAPLGGIGERNQGAFPNNVISLSRNCDHGGDVFSDCLRPVFLPAFQQHSPRPPYSLSLHAP